MLARNITLNNFNIFLTENAVSGDEFKDLRGSDLKDLIPLFSLRKKLRDWLNSVVSKKRLKEYCMAELKRVKLRVVMFLFFLMGGGAIRHLKYLQ